MEVAILKFYKYEKGGELKTIFFVKKEGIQPKKYTSLSFLSNENITTIVSFDFPNIIDDIKSISKYTYIDIEQQLKQILGLPKSYYENTKKEWSFWFQLKKHVHDVSQIKKYKKIYSNLIENATGDEIDNTYFILVNCLYEMYKQNKIQLKEKFENQRFEEIEKPLNTILFERTQKGIGINIDLVKKYINRIIVELYATRNELQLEYGIFSSKDYSKIKQKILELGFTKGIDKIGTEKYYNFLKYHHKDYKLIDLLYKERRLNDSKSVLTRLGSFDEKRVYPHYDCFGTVTSRILVKNPSFQQLKKEYRDIIIPDENKELIYFDYSQFEAGILAHEMNDRNLIDLYNSGDIYSKMQETLSNSNFDRDKCKSLFFLYSYGATLDQIKSKYTSYDLEIFFSQFSQFKPFKKQLEDSFAESGFINTILGNHRYKTPETELWDDVSWLVSQRIQGTASLILKKVINRIYNYDKEIEFLLPMHDAVLYQIPSSSAEIKKNAIKEIFEEELKSICPNLNPKVFLKKFNE
jgi:DNA polymerase I-like protein with 3'-5' exonuclease and polymerase domains